MSGYTPDEKLRVQQLWNLRRKWLKDQELSPREPVGARPVQTGWTYRVIRSVKTGFTLFLLPSWIVHYWMKYHMLARPYSFVESRPKLFPGDTILETGEVLPDFPKTGDHDESGHH
ncbi:NADH dehydrogenase [ubiquinone] 1 beta subcomplex subunit 6 [Salminus brasiliensis]|uniref:NADH dehydrogenase [ubiquinone] 1 beta subcomplex subunit 6 n=1 Tax=Salminus brasiliensis TaxID=930266 RepID=UPI003B82D2EE